MKIYLKIFCFIFLLASGSEVYSQGVIWRQIIGERYNEIGYNCIELRDGGYLMAGFKEILVPGTSFIIPKSYLVRLDHYGNILWEKIIGDSVSPNISPTLTEDYLGNIYLPYTSDYAHLVKMDSQGSILWEKDYSSYNIVTLRGISFVDNFKCIVSLSQNVIQGFPTSSVTKLDSNGNMIWNKAYYDSISLYGTYTSSNNSFWFSDKTYFICGFSKPTSGVENRIGLIIKLDTNGNIIWNKRFPQCKGVFSIAQNSENTFIASCQADAAGYLYCQKFDSSGNIIWSKNYRDDSLSYSTGYSKIIKNTDNKFALGTIAGHNYAGLLIIDSLGNITKSRFYYYPENYIIEQHNINNTSDSGYIVAGNLDSNNINNSTYNTTDDLSTSISHSEIGLKRIDVLIFKIDKYGNTVSIKNNSSFLNVNFNISIYPNPYNLSFNINFNIINKSDVRIILYDISGKIVKKIENTVLNQGNYQFIVNTPELSSGIYFLKIDINNKLFSKKILLIK